MTVSNWNNPQTSQQYVDHFASIREKDEELAVMFDGTSPSNLPTGAIKINSGQGFRLEKWDGTTWNAITAKLGNLNSALEGLTAGEISQLQKISSVTVSNTQWGWLGGLTAQPVTSAGDGLNKSGSNLLVDGTVLRDADLAANGGTVAETDRINTFNFKQRIKNSSPIIEFFGTNSVDKNFSIELNSDINFFNIQERDDNFNFLRFHSGFTFGGGQQVGQPAGGDKGPGTFNGELYDNGNRVVDRSGTTPTADWYEEATVELGQDFDAGENVKIVRVGNQVTISSPGFLNHDNVFVARSSTNAIPSQFRPNNTVANITLESGSTVLEVSTDSTGQLAIKFFNWDGTDEKDFESIFSITYNRNN